MVCEFHSLLWKMASIDDLDDLAMSMIVDGDFPVCKLLVILYQKNQLGDNG